VTNSPLVPSAVTLHRALVPALILAAALAGGCSPGFDPYNRLTEMRVLALKSDPVAPAPGETTTLSSLIYLPSGEEIASLRWSWCPFAGNATDGYPCLITEEELAQLGGGSAEDIPPFDLGDGETAALEHTLDPDLLAAVCRNTEDQPVVLDCDGGFPVQIKLTARTRSGQEVDTVRALHLRFADDQDPNQNPVVEGLRAVVDGREVEIGPDPTVTLPRREDTVVRAKVPQDAIETYTGKDEQTDMPEEKVEQLILTWFVESGDTKNMRTTFIDGVEPLTDAVENEWNPDAVIDYAPDTSQIVVVVRDDRDGVAWQRGMVALEDSP